MKIVYKLKSFLQNKIIFIHLFLDIISYFVRESNVCPPLLNWFSVAPHSKPNFTAPHHPIIVCPHLPIFVREGGRGREGGDKKR